jgi:hypothetical protein
VAINVHRAFASAFDLPSVYRNLERLISNVEFRRNNALREIDMHRTNFGLRLRQSLQAVEDAEFEEIDPDAAAEESTADAPAAAETQSPEAA